MNVSPKNPILDRVLGPVTELLTPAVARGIADMRADPEVQDRFDELAKRSTQGRLTEAERQEYREYIEALELVGILQAKAREVLERNPAA